MFGRKQPKPPTDWSKIPVSARVEIKHQHVGWEAQVQCHGYGPHGMITGGRSTYPDYLDSYEEAQDWAEKAIETCAEDVREAAVMVSDTVVYRKEV